MGNPKQVNCFLLVLSVASVTLVGAQDVVEQNNTKTIGLQDPNIDGTIKSALENGSVSEVVVRKDLLLFPVNAPNLVIAHTQEIHAVPQINGSDTDDGKPNAAEVAEVNEYSLSQLVSSNETKGNNVTGNEAVPIATAFAHQSQNNSVLEPGKLLEIVSGFNLSSGLSTSKVPLPNEVQNITLPKQSIVDLLSKSLSNATVTTDIPAYDDVMKRSIPSNDDDDNSKSSDTEESSEEPEDDENDNGNKTLKRSTDSIESMEISNNNATSENGTKVNKRSVDSDEQDHDDDDDDADDSGSFTMKPSDMEKRSLDSSINVSSSSSTTTITNYMSTTDLNVKKRSIDSEDDDGDDDSSTTYYDHLVENSLDKSTVNNSDTQAKDLSRSVTGNNQQENLIEDPEEGMDVAEDIVFRPLFRYRQETRLRQPIYSHSRSYSNRRTYDSYDSDYN